MIILYFLLITAANLLTAKFEPIALAGGALIIPLGSLFSGAVFILRDLFQLKHGKWETYLLIMWAAVFSGHLSVALGDKASVAVASMVAFFASEAVDTEIFSRVRRSLAARILLSGVVGGCMDSLLFVILGLSPLGANMITWAAVPAAVLGQLLVKTGVQIAAMCFILTRNKKTKGRKP